MGRPVLQWSPIQLRMANQQKIFPMGRLEGVTVDIEGVSAQADFEVIEIVDESNPYPALLGIDCATDMNRVINFKKCKMIFEKKSLRVVVPLDPAEGARYTELVREDDNDDDLDCIYKITVCDRDWANPIADGRISWERESSCSLDSDEEVEQWQNRLHEVTTPNCSMMVRSLSCVTTEARELPTYDGFIVVDEFLKNFKAQYQKSSDSMH